MEHRIIAIFCLIDEFLKEIGYKDDKRAYISSSEILLIGYLAVSDFNGNYSKAHKYIMSMNLVKKIEYSRFIRRLSKLEKEVEGLFIFLSKLFVKLNSMNIYSIDSFPVELCNITREKQVKLWSDIKLKGYNASKKRYFYGFKVHMVVSQHKEPISLYISEGSMHDTTASYNLLPYLPNKSIAVGDKGYVSNKLESFLLSLGISLSPIYKQNMKKDSDYFIKRKIRKGVETTFSVITSKFGKVIKATSISGFLIKLKLFITAYSIDMFLKLDESKQRLAFN